MKGIILKELKRYKAALFFKKASELNSNENYAFVNMRN